MGILERKNSIGKGVEAGKHGVLSINSKCSSLAGAEFSLWKEWALVMSFVNDKKAVG